MAVGTLSSAAFAENGTIDPADLNWEKPEETINISVYAGEGDQELLGVKREQAALRVCGERSKLNFGKPWKP